ncbi:MAG: tetratricopeptide repeat protein [Phycisphaerales bacterium]|nr:tetratricopeptide repeat protein [Phycisphaerales bacterium]
MTPPKYTIKYRLKSKGSIEAGTLGLMIAAVVSLGLIVLAGRSLLGVQAPAPAVTPPAPQGISQSAPTQTIEQVLESVQVYVSSGEFQPAVAILRSAIAKYPGDADLRFALADLFMLTKDFTQAYEQTVAAIEHSQGIDPKAQFTAGTLANTIDQPEMSLVHYQAAMQGDQQNPDYPLYLANIQFKLNKLEEAKASLAIAARLAPDRAKVWATWAKISLRQNKLSLAQQHIQKTRQLEPHVPAWIILEANIQKRSGNPERAIELLSALPQEALDDPESMRLLAESYGMIGRPEEAASRMVDFATLHNDNAQAAFDAAIWLDRAKQRGDAVLWGRRARDLGHKRAQGWLDSLSD